MAHGSIRMISRLEVEHALAQIDAVEVIENILQEKHLQRAMLPAEATLYWQTADGRTARSISMPGALPAWRAYGVKLINSSLANPDRGLARASGLLMMFDPETAEIVAVMDAARLSGYRTAVMSLVGARRLIAEGPIHLGLIGCGPIGRTHLELFTSNLDIEAIMLHDVVSARAEAAEDALAASGYCGAVKVVASVTELAAETNCVIAATTVTSPYIFSNDLRPGQTILNVSLDDLDETAFLQADAIWVDDTNLVLEDPRRRLGHLLRAGAPIRMAGEVERLIGENARGRKAESDIVIFNPFGMSILDVGLAHAVLGRLPADGHSFVADR